MPIGESRGSSSGTLRSSFTTSFPVRDSTSSYLHSHSEAIAERRVQLGPGRTGAKKRRYALQESQSGRGDDVARFHFSPKRGTWTSRTARYLRLANLNEPVGTKQLNKPAIDKEEEQIKHAGARWLSSCFLVVTLIRLPKSHRTT